MKKSQPALFDGYLVENGVRRRAKRAEIAEAHRLWWKHRDIREGRVAHICRKLESSLRSDDSSRVPRDHDRRERGAA